MTYVPIPSRKDASNKTDYKIKLRKSLKMLQDQAAEASSPETAHMIDVAICALEERLAHTKDDS